MDNLKPCPFCGRKIWLNPYKIDHRIDDIVIFQWSIFCDASYHRGGCGAMCGYHDTKEEAIEAWNRRAGEDENSV